MSGQTTEPAEEIWGEIVRMKIEALNAGRVRLVVQDGRVIQVESQPESAANSGEPFGTTA
jgi:hypothetical protein